LYCCGIGSDVSMKRHISPPHMARSPVAPEDVEP
jgi:hypothetical protein